MDIVGINLEENREFAKDWANGGHVKIEKKRTENRTLRHTRIEGTTVGYSGIEMDGIRAIREIRADKRQSRTRESE